MKTRSISLLIILIFLVRINNSLAQPTRVKEIKGVHVKTLHSEILNEERKLYIYIPENSQTAKLPVIYILDGHSPFTFREAIDYTKTKPHILVGISTKENRDRDTIPVKISQKKNSGGSKNFLRFLVEELQPYINTNYPSNNENVLYGASNSGLFTIYAMLEDPDGFQAYLASSPMIGHCKDYMVEKLNSFSQPERLKGKSLYIKWGMKDIYEQVTVDLPPYIELLSQLPELSMKVTSLKNGKHVPSGSLSDGLKFIYQ